MKTLNENEIAQVSGGMDALAFEGLFEGLIALGFIAGFVTFGLGAAAYAGYQYYRK